MTKGPFAGGTLTWTFANDGTYIGVINGSSTYTWGGTWTLVGSTFTLNDTSGTFACPVGQFGTYAVTFAPTCNTADFALTSDVCTGRTLVIDKVHLTRS